MDAAKEASHEHPARVLGVILGDGRGAGQVNAQVGTGQGWSGETALIRLKGEVRQAPRVGRAAAAAARLPRRRLVAHRPPRRPGRRPARPARPAPDHRRGVRVARQAQGAARPVRGLLPRQHRPGLDPDHPVAGAARRRARPAPAQGPAGASVTAERISPSADLLRRLAARPAKVPATPANSDGPRHHRGGDGDRRGRHPDRRGRRQAGHVHLPGPARPTGRAQAPRRCPSCSARSCAGSTRTTCTPRPPSGC